MSPTSSESPLKEIEKDMIFDSRYKRYTDYINPEGSTSEVVIAIISFLVSIEVLYHITINLLGPQNNQNIVCIFQNNWIGNVGDADY